MQKQEKFKKISKFLDFNSKKADLNAFFQIIKVFKTNKAASK